MSLPAKFSLHLSAALLVLTAPNIVHGQEVIHWESFEPCRICHLPSREVLSFGEAEGPGIIESEIARVVARPDRGYLVFGQGRQGGHRITLFDPEGRFVRSIGREGEGPGELGNVTDVVFVGSDRLIVADNRRRALITFRETGEFVEQVSIPELRGGRVRMIEGDTAAVLATMGRLPANAGYPLHLIDLRGASEVKHFGASDVTPWSIAEPYATALVLGEEGYRLNETVWWGKVGRPHLEEWSLDGHLTRIVTGDPEWFPLEPAPARAGEPAPPRAAVAAFAVDGRDRLWILTYIPDDRWREAVLRGPEGGVPGDQADRYRDIRLDVFDLTTRRHLGYRVWDSIDRALVRRGDQVLVSVVEYEDPEWPRVVLYQFEVNDSPE